jgi:hypothetical protein
MYHGMKRIARQHHRQQYVPGVGSLTVAAGVVEAWQHYYTCDHCSQAFHFPEAAEEAFYCHSASCKAVKLVSIDCQ